jgi:DNA transformation protein
VSVCPGFRAFVLEQLARVRRDIRARNMFGGVGIYASDLFFALVDDDQVYFKVDDQTRAGFEVRGMGPFMPGGAAGEVMQYYQLPDDVLEDPEKLGPWVEDAIDVARRRKSRSRRH